MHERGAPCKAPGWLLVLLVCRQASGDKERLDPKLVLKGKTGKAAEVVVWHNVVVSCKGQVFQDCRVPENECDAKLPWTHPSKALIGCGDDRCLSWDGCGFGGGSCDPRVAWSHVTREAAFVCEDGDVESPCDPKQRLPKGPVDVLVVLTQPQWGAYYHFVIDSLSRVMWVQDQYPQVMQDPKTYFHTGLVSPVGQTWAQLVGIRTSAGRDNRLLEGWWKAKKAYFPPGNACANNKVGVQPFAIQAMNKAVVAHPKVGAALPQPRTFTALLVQRQKTNNRKVLNHDEVLKEMRQALQGWNVQIFSDYPREPGVLETCRMFYVADMVVGPHGAGFANLVCARKGVPLVEFQQKYHSWDYELLSMKLGLPYFGIPTEMDHYGPGKVSIEELRSAVRRALRSPMLAEPTAAPAPVPVPTTTTPRERARKAPTAEGATAARHSAAVAKLPPSAAIRPSGLADTTARGVIPPSAPVGPPVASLPTAVTMSTVGVGLPTVRSVVSFMMGFAMSSAVLLVCTRWNAAGVVRVKAQEATPGRPRASAAPSRVVGSLRQVTDDEPTEDNSLLRTG